MGKRVFLKSLDSSSNAASERLTLRYKSNPQHELIMGIKLTLHQKQDINVLLDKLNGLLEPIGFI